MLLFKTLNTMNAQKIFRIISQKPEYIKIVCNDRNNPFQIAC